MNARRYALIVFAALAALFIAGNVIVSTWFAGARLDLTQNRIYTLSQGTRQVLRGLGEPMTLTFYYSRDAAAQDPGLRTYGARVREMLHSYERQSRGKVRVVEVNPIRFTEAEDDAQRAGMEPITLETGGDPIYIGIEGANAIDEKLPLPQLDPRREPYLEYDLTRLVSELENPAKKKIALITALPWEPAMAGNPQFAAQSGQPLVLMEMARIWDVEKLAPDFTTIPVDADTLAIIHPWGLSAQQLYAVDQFLMTKGRAFIALDPVALTASAGGFNPMQPEGAPQSASDLAPILKALGVTMSSEAVIDAQNALQIRAMTPDGREAVLPQPIFFSVLPEQLDRADLLTAEMARGLNFGAPGGLEWTAPQGVKIEQLARTTGITSRIGAQQALMSQNDPTGLLQGFVPANKQETLALRVSGRIASAFGAARPPGVSADNDAVHVPAAKQDALIVVVSDVDFLNDAFYMAGPGAREPMMDNGAFAINALDQLGGDAALISLRSRAPSLRRMDVVERIRNDAQRRALDTQEALQAELARTESELRELQASGAGSGFFEGNLGAEMTAQERGKVEELRAKMLDARTQLRRVERGFRTDLDRLEGWLILLNVWLAPILVVGGGLFWLRRRQQRAVNITKNEAKA
jgi:ABC-type uncharacterized transport system involved in gliding motility auxiliary subunit